MENLRIPGPTPLPNEVLRSLTKQMIDHRGPEFQKLMGGVTEKLKQLFQTKNDVLVLTASGTGAMEASIVNTLSPGDKVLAVSIGEFGERFISIAEQFGLEVTPLKFEPGKPADPSAIRKALDTLTNIKAVIVTHNETSTGITNDMASIAKIVKEHEKLLIVDAISGLGSINLPVDEWKIDIAMTGSQKGWMAPPGMAMVSVSPEAWKAHASAKLPRFYWDFTRAKTFAAKNQTPWTPAVSIVYAFSVSLDMMLKEGLPNIFARHARVAKAAREGAKALGLAPFANEDYASNTVTAITASNGLDPAKMIQILRDEHKVILSGGQGKLSGKIFRIGHLGWVSEDDIKGVMAALKIVLPQAGFKRS